MGAHKLNLMLAAVMGAAAAIVPSLAAGDAPSSASFTAFDFGWDANGGAGNQVTIAPGGTVNFGYPTGASTHNVDFGSGPQPTSCAQDAGASSGSVPPLPTSPTAPGWSGSCTFNTPGTYTFHCDLHAFMKGTIVVGTATTTTATTPTTISTTTPPTAATTTSTVTPTPPPLTPPKVSISHRQRGTAVAGTVKTADPNAGEALEVDLLVPARVLGLQRHGSMRVGSLVRRHLPPGTSHFSVGLTRRARRVLHRRRGLAVTVHVVLGHAKPTTFTVLLRP